MPAVHIPVEEELEAPALSAFQEVRVVQSGSELKLELRALLNMTRDAFSRVVGVSVRTIAAVEREQALIEKLQRPYAQLGRLYAALSEVVSAEAIGPWFAAPNPAFNGMKPMEVIERGEIDRLWEMVYRLRSGLPS